MTKEQANAIKKVVKSEVGDFTVYFNSKKGELRITVHQWQDGGNRNVERERQNILDILNALTNNGIRAKWRRSYKRYQGFLNCSYMVFE